MADKNAYRIKLPGLDERHQEYRLALAYRVGDLVFTSGQLGIDNDGNMAGANDYDKQVEQVFANLDRVLKAAGSGNDKIIRTTVYQTNIRNLPRFVELRGKYLKAPYPASTQVAITMLGHPQAMIEIDAIALVEGEIVN
jgi:enamine deaminase RidA (YjgF/YER057c/UK114 family)